MRAFSTLSDNANFCFFLDWVSCQRRKDSGLKRFTALAPKIPCQSVTLSCQSPGVWPPVRTGGTRWSSASQDLSLLASLRGDPRLRIQLWWDELFLSNCNTLRVCEVGHGLRSLLYAACEVEGWSQAGWRSRGGAPGRQVGDDCGPHVGQNRSQRSVQRIGLRHRKGCLARSLHGSRWVRTINHAVLLRNPVLKYLFIMHHAVSKRFCYLLLVSDTTSGQANQIMKALVWWPVCSYAVSPAVITRAFCQGCHLLKYNARLHTHMQNVIL